MFRYSAYHHYPTLQLLLLFYRPSDSWPYMYAGIPWAPRDACSLYPRLSICSFKRKPLISVTITNKPPSYPASLSWGMHVLVESWEYYILPHLSGSGCLYRSHIFTATVCPRQSAWNTLLERSPPSSLRRSRKLNSEILTFPTLMEKPVESCLSAYL